MTAAQVRKALGERSGLARCPVHKGGQERTPSLAVSDGPDGKLLVHCHAGCSQKAVWQALKDRGLVGNEAHALHLPNVSTSRQSEKTSAQRRAEALAIWQASVPALHTTAQAYLQGRGIVLQPPACLRYHRRLNVLVALVQARDGAFSGIQRIFLTTDNCGTWKRDRLSLGPINHGAVRLTPTAPALQLCESVEDGLALLQMTGRPTWAVCGAKLMANFEPPPEVRTLVLAPDNDTAGRAAIEKANCQFDNKRLRQLLPPAGMDWCNLLEHLDERLAIKEEPATCSWVEEFVDG